MRKVKFDKNKMKLHFLISFSPALVLFDRGADDDKSKRSSGLCFTACSNLVIFCRFYFYIRFNDIDSVIAEFYSTYPSL